MGKKLINQLVSNLRVIINIYYIKIRIRMSKDVNSKLLNQMAYGSISCRDVPGDIEDYNVSLIR